MRRTTLRRRLTFLFWTIIVSVVVVMGVFIAQQGKQVLIDQARRTGIALARSIAAASSNDFFSYNYVALEQKAEKAARDHEVAYIVLYDKEGHVAAYSGQGVPGSETDIPPLKNMTPGQDPIVTGNLLIGKPGPGLDIALPVLLTDTGQTWGTVRLGLRLDRIYSEIQKTYWVIFMLGFSGILIGWAASAHFTSRITVPLGNLVDATVKVSDGDFDTRIEASTGDEVQDLAENFNWMVSRLKDQRNNLEENLQEISRLKHYSDLVILSMTNGLITMDADGRAITFNRKAEEILDTSAEKALGSTPTEIWGESNDIIRLLEDSLSNRKPIIDLEVQWPGKTGEDRILELNTALIQEENGQVIGLLALFHDLTEKKALEVKVRRADRLAAMGTLAAGLAHEIKNPLTAVRAFVQMLPEKHEKMVFREKFNRIVPRELDRVNELLENLLDLVRTPKLKITPLNITECVDHVLETLEPEIQSRSIIVQRFSDDEGLRVYADNSYLSRALYNIALNAVQAMPDGGTLTVETTANPVPGKKHLADIRISDTGTGIPQEHTKDIFNPFFTSKEKGTGLGLAVTNKIIEDQSGTILVESERGEGTTFTVTLPSAGSH